MEKMFFFSQIKKSWKFNELIYFLAFSDIKTRYSKSILGPMWASLSIGIFVVAFGIIGSRLWGLDLNVFMPFFSAGYITWILISNIISESTNLLSNVSNTIKSTDTPFFVFNVSLVLKNLILFFHHLIIFFLVCLVLSFPISIKIFFIFPSLIIIFIIGTLFSYVWSIICTRFNDMAQLTTNLLQILFFLTPVFWPAERLKGIYFKLLVDFNPVFQILSLIRQPLLGKSLELANIIYVLVTFLVLLILSVYLGNRYRKNIIFFV